MKKYIKAVLIIHTLMVSALLIVAEAPCYSTAIGDVVGKCLVEYGILSSQEELDKNPLLYAAEVAKMTAFSSPFMVANSIITPIYIAIPFAAPVIAALEHFDVIDIGDWF